MITCRCPRCQALFKAPSKEFGQMVSCASCSHSWTLDIDEIARYGLPRVLRVHVRDEAGTAIAGREIEIEYNYPLLKVRTGSDGDALVTDDMIRQGLSEYVARDGIMDHSYDDHACQRYIYLHLGRVKKAVDLSVGKSEVEVDFRVQHPQRKRPWWRFW